MKELILFFMGVLVLMSVGLEGVQSSAKKGNRNPKPHCGCPKKKHPDYVCAKVTLNFESICELNCYKHKFPERHYQFISNGMCQQHSHPVTEVATHFSEGASRENENSALDITSFNDLTEKEDLSRQDIKSVLESSVKNGEVTNHTPLAMLINKKINASTIQ